MEGISKDVSAYVKGCVECNQNKKATVSAKHPMLSYHSGSPMERVHLDLIGPLPRTERGNEHILMMVDQFTKWVECIPLPSQSAEETARAAVNQFFSRFGCPFKYSLIRGGILSSLCSGKGVNYFTYINRELPLTVPRRTDK